MKKLYIALCMLAGLGHLSIHGAATDTPGKINLRQLPKTQEELKQQRDVVTNGMIEFVGFPKDIASLVAGYTIEPYKVKLLVRRCNFLMETTQALEPLVRIDLLSFEPDALKLAEQIAFLGADKVVTLSEVPKNINKFMQRARRLIEEIKLLEKQLLEEQPLGVMTGDEIAKEMELGRMYAWRIETMHNAIQVAIKIHNNELRKRQIAEQQAQQQPQPGNNP